MKWLQQVFLSSIGCKAVMAITGLFMGFFLIGHVAGNLLVFGGPDAINQYAKGLRDVWPLLWVARSGLILIIILHIYAAIRLTRLNKKAKPITSSVAKPVQASLSSRTMMLSGFVILSFIIYHLAHLTFKVTHPEFENLAPGDVYQMLIISFKSPVVSLFYIISVSLLMLHLSHGISSLFQTLGLNHPKYNIFIRRFGPIFSFLLAASFLSVPISILLGWVA